MFYQMVEELAADVNAVSRAGFTALHVAVNLGHEDIVRLLLAADADIHVSSEFILPARVRQFLPPFFFLDCDIARLF